MRHPKMQEIKGNRQPRPDEKKGEKERTEMQEEGLAENLPKKACHTMDC